MSRAQRVGPVDKAWRPSSTASSISSSTPPTCRAPAYTDSSGGVQETIHVGPSSYLALELGQGIDGGIVECDREPPLWLPYVEVADVAEATERARLLGASVLLEPQRAPEAGAASWRPRRLPRSLCGSRSHVALDIFRYRYVIARMARAATTADAFNAVAEPATADPRRPRRRRAPVNDLVRVLGLAQPQVSKHLRVLREGAVDVRDQEDSACTG